MQSGIYSQAYRHILTHGKSFFSQLSRTCRTTAQAGETSFQKTQPAHKVSQWPALGDSTRELETISFQVILNSDNSFLQTGKMGKTTRRRQTDNGFTNILLSLLFSVAILHHQNAQRAHTSISRAEALTSLLPENSLNVGFKFLNRFQAIIFFN